jgi:3-dehydroquinate synthase
MQYSLTFPTGTVKYIFQTRFTELKQYIDTDNCILLIDTRVAGLYTNLFKSYRKILIQADEPYKTWAQVSNICDQLLSLEADRKTTLIGIGGGITTDITGFVASVYMRGIQFGFVPTTLLSMCDAAIGGKNGVNQNLQKNLIGTIQQPSFIFYDTGFLQTLSSTEWSNGFAEVIKYACLFDEVLFEELEQNDVPNYQNNQEALQLLIERCADWKNNVVMSDEKESGRRKLLNFGHTAGHAIETLYNIPHGFAVSVGMVIAAKISEQESGLNSDTTERLRKLLQRYGLPISTVLESERVMQILSMDKKRNSEGIDYILLKNIGEATIQHLSFEQIKFGLETYTDAGSR